MTIKAWATTAANTELSGELRPDDVEIAVETCSLAPIGRFSRAGFRR